MPIFVPDADGLSPEELMEELGVLLAATYEQVELEVVEQVAKHAYKIIELQNDANNAQFLAQRQRLHDVAQARAEAMREIQEIVRQNVVRISEENLAETLVDIAAKSGSAHAVGSLQLPSGVPFAPSQVEAVTILTMDLHNRLEILNQRILRYPMDAYQKVISETAPFLLLGAETSLNMQKRAVYSFVNQGITGFTDKANRNWRIGTYAEMAGRTAAQRAWQDAGIARMQSSGINLVSPIVANDGCKLCHRWNGTILSTNGVPAGVYMIQHATEDRVVPIQVDGTLEDARRAGYNHPNCRCQAPAFQPGVSRVATNPYDPEAEEARKRQREIEVKIRAAKRSQVTAPDQVTELKAKKKVRELQAEMRAHLKATGRLRSSYREQLHFAA